MTSSTPRSPSTVASPSLSSALLVAAKAQLRKLSADAANQIVTALCAGIFTGLLYYLGRDFFHHKLAESDHAIKAWLYLVFYHLANAFLAKYLTGKLLSPEALALTAEARRASRLSGNQATQPLPALLLWLGEAPAKVRRLAMLLKASDVVLVGVALALLASSPFMPYSPGVCLAIFAGYAALMVALSAAFHNISRQGSAGRAAPPTARSFIGTVLAMIGWRWRQLYRHNFSVLFYGVLTLLALLAASYLAAGGLDYRLAGFIFAMAGFFVAAPLFHQLKEDLTASWFERNNPVSHRHVICCYLGLALAHALIWMAIAGLCLAATAWLTNSGQIPYPLSHAAIWLGLIAICPILTPGLLFQIDGTKPMIQLIIAFMATVVISSLVLIEPLVWLAVPFAGYIAAYYQQGRYYRA